jgi:hypothetical protein
MATSGAWKQRAYHDPPPFRFEVDPRHGETNEEDLNANTYAAPPLPEVSEVGEFPGMEYLTPLPGVVLDYTPVTHDGSAYPLRDNDREMQLDSLKAHGENFGASRASNFVPGAMDFYDERQVHTVVEGYGFEATQGISPLARTRGLNGLPENNPDGFNPGRTELWRYDRRLYAPERRHDERPTTLNTPAFAGNVPVAAPDKFVPWYNSPFSSLARPVTRNFQLPEIRRDPRGISADITSDGAYAESQPLGAEWVM